MYTLLDLFAGAGGLSKGFEMTGQFQIVGMSENNKYAEKTYKLNHENVKNYGDILKLPYNDIRSECGNIDVIIGGPPCQGFSNANRQRRTLINGSNELVKAYVKAIEELQPKVFVMENVKTIESDKHHFCVTHADKSLIENELGIQPKEKVFELYKGENAQFVCQNVDNITLITDQQLYLIKNLLSPKKNIEKLFLKREVRNGINDIVDTIREVNTNNFWFSDILENTATSIINIQNQKICTDEDRRVIQKFWDIQRYCCGINELREKDVIFDTKVVDEKIMITVNAYIVIDYIRKSFEKLNYKIDACGVMKAAEFGVPQTRERFILIGVKDENCYEGIDLRLPKPLITEKRHFTKVKEAIEDLEAHKPGNESMDYEISVEKKENNETFYRHIINDESNVIYNHVCTASRSEAKKRFAKIEQGQNFHDLPDELKGTYDNPERTQNTIYKRLQYDQPSDTVVNVRKSMWIHPKENRAISAREAARLQSFPDSYIFSGTKDAVYQQIGNAVPPILGRAVAEKVLEFLQCDNEFEKLEDIYKKYRK